MEEYYDECEDNFESQFQDELETMKELQDEEEERIKKYKRKLDFSSPKYVPQQSPVKFSVAENLHEPVSKKPKIDYVIPSSPKSSFLEIPMLHSPNENNKENFMPVLSQISKPKKTLNSINDTIPITGFDGNRMNLKIRSTYDDVIEPKSVGQLLATPYTALRDQVERDRESKLLKENGDMTLFGNDENRNISLDEDLYENNAIREFDNKLLWVEKFKPKNYTELLSDDGINRSLLSWLKQWDKAVFGTEVSSKILQQTNPASKNNDNQLKQFGTLDELNRPFYKTALLYGSPGLGKTTLAYIIANHAGYNVVEMNASDDRSVEIFQKQLEAATQMRSVIGVEPKPNCLIIDEIDGAPAPAINALVSFIKAARIGKKKTPVLLRPVICICNDLYQPSLRPLRQLAFVLTFPPTASVRLASRLSNIAHKENLKTDRNAMLALCIKTENDIRSCLSTLQFLRNLKKPVTVKDIIISSVGQKDVQRSIFNIWQCIFQIPRAIKKMQSIEDTANLEGDETSISGRFAKVLRLVQSYGEYEKVTQGIFENYLEINFKDPLMENICIGTDYFCDSDIFQSHIARTQIYSILPYLPYFITATHFLFSSLTYSKINYPTALQECKNKTNQVSNVVASMINYASPIVRSFNNSSSMILQLLPYLPLLIQPVFRPVSFQLFSEKEKAELKRIIEIMIAYNLVYRQERSTDGLYTYILEPNIEQVIQFTDSKTNHNLTYATKNLITRELELEKMRRTEKKELKHVTEELAPNYKQKLKPKAILEIEAVDFFGRKVEKKSDDKVTDQSSPNGDIWFHFKEGYTNAARRIVYIKDLF